MRLPLQYTKCKECLPLYALHYWSIVLAEENFHFDEELMSTEVSNDTTLLLWVHLPPRFGVSTEGSHAYYGVASGCALLCHFAELTQWVGREVHKVMYIGEANNNLATQASDCKPH